MSHSRTCSHCAAGDHDHLDSRDHARTRRRQLAGFIAARIAIMLVALIAPAALLSSPGLATVTLAVGIGVALWVLTIAAGVLVSALLLRRVGRVSAMMSGALAAAGLTPPLALGAAAFGPGTWLYATMVAAGFLTGAFTSEAVRLWQLRALLGQDTRAGEVARDSAAITHAQDQDVSDLLSTLLMAALVGAYVWLTGLLWILVVVLVPLHVAVVALRRRKALLHGRLPFRSGEQPAPSGT